MASLDGYRNRLTPDCLGFMLRSVKLSAFTGLIPRRTAMWNVVRAIWSDDQGQDIAEYAVMVAVILIIVVGTLRLIGSNSNTVFSNVASTIQ
jgi:Flp pilus assembly pilin Flp